MSRDLIARIEREMRKNQDRFQEELKSLVAAEGEAEGLAYDPKRWEYTMFVERFLYPLCEPTEAAALRAFGKIFYLRCLEYAKYLDLEESRVVCELRGALRDLMLLARFVEAVGNSFDTTEIQPADRPMVRLAAEIAPQLDEIARRLEEELPNEKNHG